MAANAEVIKEFLVSLGYQVDERGKRRFVEGVGAATKQVFALGTAAAAAATAVVAATAKIAAGLEELYHAAQRNNSTVETLRALEFGAKQFGASAQDAVESLGRFMRSSPGASSFLRGLGVATQDANGNLRDTGDILTDLGARLKAMPYYRAKAYADFLGIDERTLMAMQRGLGQYAQQYRDMLSAAQVDSEQAAAASHGFMVELRTLGAAFEILGRKAGAQMAGRLSDQIRRFREWIVQNFDMLTKLLTRTVELLARIGEVIGLMVLRAGQALRALLDWFENLDESTQNVLKTVGLIGAAWMALNSTFLATPLGRILALAGAIALLVDDFLVWKEGGKSLIDWSQWEGQINEAISGLTRLAEVLERIWDRIGPILDKFSKDLGFGDFGKYVSDSVQEIKDIGQLGGRLLSGDLAGAKEVLKERQDRRLPRGIRNNNPGNLVFARQRGAEKEKDGPFAVFKTAEEGLRAMARQLRLYGERGLDTISEVVKEYAPPEENDTPAYIRYVSEMMGINPDERFDVNSDPAALAALMQAIIKHENGQNPYSAEQINAAAGLQSASRTAEVSQRTEINIHGVTDAAAAGQAVAREQRTVNEQLIRNLRGAVQ